MRFAHLIYDTVCRLQKAVYGLKQAAACWCTELDNFMGNLDFVKLESENCMYVRKENNEKMYVLVYVDDMLVVYLWRVTMVKV